MLERLKRGERLADGRTDSACCVASLVTKWQIWTALLLHVLLRFQAFLTSWPCAFTRLWAICRSITWNKIDFLELLCSYGTAALPVEQLAFWFINREKQGLKTNWPKDSVYQQFATQDLLGSVTAVLEKYRRWTL
jgi:hypothetical protein